MKKWINPNVEGKSKNVLMCDLEQVLVVSAIDFLEREDIKVDWAEKYKAICHPRSFSNYFIHRAGQLFDEVYLNTTVSDEKAKAVVDKIWPNNFKCYNWSNGLKSGGYEKFGKDVQLFHLEDNILGGNLDNDVLQMKKLGVHVFDVEPYNGYYTEKEIMEDDSLKVVISDMSRYLVGKK